jgi:hypothetical protein
VVSFQYANVFPLLSPIPPLSKDVPDTQTARQSHKHFFFQNTVNRLTTDQFKPVGNSFSSSTLNVINTVMYGAGIA